MFKWGTGVRCVGADCGFCEAYYAHADATNLAKSDASSLGGLPCIGDNYWTAV